MATSQDTVSSGLPPSDWMAELPEKLHTWPLMKLAIPGSHNSATFGIDPKAECAPDAPTNVANSVRVPVLGEAVRAVCRAWSVCQKLDFRQQLESGIRYFDLRISTKPGSEDFYFVHTLYGPKLSEMLESVSSYLSEHRKEVVLLDLNHFYGMEEEHHAMLLSLLTSHFGEKLMPCGDPRQVTLRHMWDLDKQVLVFYQHDLASSFTEVWPASSIIAPWANTPHEEQCLQFLSQRFDQPQPDHFVVCQGILSPTPSHFLNVSSSLESMVCRFRPRIYSWISQRAATHPYSLNIVMVDFAQGGDFVQRVLSLNLTRAEAK
ncbi:PI-PLC X domain-containing protein 3 [Aplysia californica]|uniref:PI-PLC X domain-containing protein 3 n=1 Tax=Aplysia californica TaxID=6500 RepID=A0ABM1VPZ1_APLCA|nr:PI-PLC X domain-containing protein 3 [Aplysia californica]XP_035824481.1 PI-PLC X domain-containing protein 3 [Aplysia californica]XP_035824482.1 PI-PLC X domain-containing protein 3 [Aplysia californica]XP_035824483.1 PI-PLC X domain-containing protein 3 [Aplysia californica]